MILLNPTKMTFHPDGGLIVSDVLVSGATRLTSRREEDGLQPGIGRAAKQPGYDTRDSESY